MIMVRTSHFKSRRFLFLERSQIWHWQPQWEHTTWRVRRQVRFTFLVAFLSPQQVVFSQDPPVAAGLRCLQEVSRGQEAQHVQSQLQTHTGAHIRDPAGAATQSNPGHCGFRLHLFGQQWYEVSLELRLDHLHHVLHLASFTPVNQLIQGEQPFRAAPHLKMTNTEMLIYLFYTCLFILLTLLLW